jgi:amino acid adenylation domain-containing protein
MTRPGRLRRFPSNAATMLLDASTASPDARAMVDPEGEVTYSVLASRALAFAESLRQLEVQPGERVAMFLPRGRDAAAAFFGALTAGAIAVLINESLRPRQIEHILGHSSAAALVTSGRMLGRLPRPLQTSATLLDVGDISSTGGGPVESRLAMDPAQIVYTSGSTGLPKGVTFSHGNLWAGMLAVTSYLGITSSDRIASLLPFSFDYGLNQLLCCVGTGATLVVDRSPLPQRIVETLRRERVTVLPAVPPLWLQLLNAETFRTGALTSLRLMTNTGGRLPTEAVSRLRRHHPSAKLVLMYGLTEAFRSTYLNPDRADRKPDSVGQAIPGTEILVLDEDLHPCSPGEVGELVHRGPTVALGYWNDPEATSQVFRPNPLNPSGTPDSERVVFSGDLVRRDDEGDIFFVGRRDRMIKTLGYRVSPDEVVDALYASGEVVEAIVDSEPDETLGARIVAYVVLTEDGRLDRLRAFCSAEMPRYLQPVRIELRTSLERTASGKHDVAATARQASDSA